MKNYLRYAAAFVVAAVTAGCCNDECPEIIERKMPEMRALLCDDGMTGTSAEVTTLHINKLPDNYNAVCTAWDTAYFCLAKSELELRGFFRNESGEAIGPGILPSFDFDAHDVFLYSAWPTGDGVVVNALYCVDDGAKTAAKAVLKINEVRLRFRRKGNHLYGGEGYRIFIAIPKSSANDSLFIDHKLYWEPC